MRILVLGGTRFIGPPAVRRLVERGHAVTVFHRGQNEAALPPGVAHLHGDRTRLGDYGDDFRRLAPEVVLDMRALSEQEGAALVTAFKGLAQRLVVISSIDVYRAYDRLRRADLGPPDPAPLTEDSPLRDKLYPYRELAKGPEEAFYNYDKILLERVVMAEPDLPATVLRLPMVYGPGDYQHRLFPYLKRMDDRRPSILLSEGEAIALCVADGRAAGRIYHVADQANLTEAEWVRRIAEAAGWPGQVLPRSNESLPAHLKDEDDPSHHLSVDSSRIRRELSYREPTPPLEAMRQTIAWERANLPAEVDPAKFDYAAEDASLPWPSKDR